MPAITVRNLSPETHQGLKTRARANGRSTEAEVRAILDAAAQGAPRVQLGSLLASWAEDAVGFAPPARDALPYDPPALS